MASFIQNLKDTNPENYIFSNRIVRKNPLDNTKRLFLCIGVFFFFFIFKCEAQPPSAKVKEKLGQITNTVHSIASDAKLICVTGDDLTLDGKSSKWIYVFKSESKSRLYEYWYEDGDIVAKSNISITGEDFFVSMGMDYVPDNWLDSDEVLSITESNGGSSYRSAHGGDVSVRLTLMPSAFGSTGEVPFLYPEAAWDISYRSQDSNPFDIALNPQTGEVIMNKPRDERTATAKELVSMMDSLAMELAPDAKLFRIESPFIDLAGKSGEWAFWYHSISRHTVFVCPYRFSMFNRSPEENPPGHNYSSMIEIPDMWINSDLAIIIIEAMGGSAFRNSHPNTEISLNLFVDENQPGLPKWNAQYHEPEVMVEFFEIPAIDVEGLSNTAQTHLEEVTALAETYAGDAELVYISGHNLSIDGDGQWDYLFKSETQQEVYEFYITLTGYIGIPNEINGYYSKEDFLACEPFPDPWIDIDSALIITENSGGAEFRQNYPDYSIHALLCISPYESYFKWEINYFSESTQQQLRFLIDAKGKSTTEDWPKTYGGGGNEVGQSVQETSDGGFIVTAYTYSFGQGMADTWLFKTDSLGNEEWNTTFGGAFNDYGQYVEVTEENGYLIAHNSENESGMYTGNLLLTDTNGNKIMETDLENSGNIEAYSIHKIADGSYVMAGSTSPGPGEASDFWLIKIDENGDEIWQKTYEGVGDDICESMQQTLDGGFILLGLTNSYGAGEVDFRLVKTDEDGNKIWDKTYGGELNDEGRSVALTSDGGYILAGYTESYGDGGQDGYLIKTDENGDEEWSKTFGTTEDESFRDVIESTDGGLVMIGNTNQNGNNDVLVIKTDSEGEEIWTQIIGDELTDIGRAICQTSDGNYILTGGTKNYRAWGMDVLLMKIDDTGIITQNTIIKVPENIIISNYPNPFLLDTKICVNIENEGNYKLRVIDMSGREVALLNNDFLHKGQHEFIWNGLGSNGETLKSGYYLAELTGNMYKQAIKILLKK